MMKRMFQDREGQIEAFAGAHFSKVKGLVNSCSNSVVVLWLYDEKTDSWHRLFNDGTYCGVDRYATDQSSQDLDDDIDIEDYSGWFNGKRLLTATVFSETSAGYNLHVLFKFDTAECRLVYHGADDTCRIHFMDLSDP